MQESIQLQIEIGANPIQKKNEIAILEQEIRILEIKQGKKPRYEEEERKSIYYVITKGPNMGIHMNISAIKGLPKEYYQEAFTKFEADKILQDCKIRSLRPNYQALTANPASLMAINSRLVKSTISKQEWIEMYNTLADNKVLPILSIHQELPSKGFQMNA